MKTLDLSKLRNNEEIEFPYEHGRVTAMRLYNIQEYDFEGNERILSDCYANPQWFTNKLTTHNIKATILRYLDAKNEIDVYLPWPNQSTTEWKQITEILLDRRRQNKGRSTYTYHHIAILNRFPDVSDLSDITTSMIRELARESEMTYMYEQTQTSVRTPTPLSTPHPGQETQLVLFTSFTPQSLSTSQQIVPSVRVVQRLTPPSIHSFPQGNLQLLNVMIAQNTVSEKPTSPAPIVTKLEN